MNLKKTFVAILLIGYGMTLSAQDQDSVFLQHFGGGPEIQVYPTGIIPGLTFYQKISKTSWLHARIGYQWIRHGGRGIHEDERGDGWGGSLGYDHRLYFLGHDWLAGGRVDLWKNTIQWKDHIGTFDEITGQSKITVLQPTLRMSDPIDWTHSVLIPSISFGTEINVATDGADTGEGLILLIGLALVFK